MASKRESSRVIKIIIAERLEFFEQLYEHEKDSRIKNLLYKKISGLKKRLRKLSP